MDDEFVVPLAKLSSLKRYQPRIESLFSVLVEGIRPDDTVIDGSTSDVWIRVKSSRANIATSPQQQQQRCQQDVQNAKEYILSLVDGTGGHEKISYSRDDFEVLRNHHSDIEINSRAVLTFNVNQSALCIQGQAINRALAQSFIALLLQDVQTPDKVSEISRRKSPPLPKSREDGFRSRGDGAGVRPAKRVLSPPCLSPTADSCYGSSDDCLTDLAGSLLSPPPVPSRSTKPHYMYPDAAPVVSPAGSSSSGSSDSELEKIQADPSYFSKVEFGVKLGYSESQVLNCLQKLGVDAPQNELLSELIKLGETQAIKSMSESDPLDRFVSGQTLSVESGNVSVRENIGDNAVDIRTSVEVEELKETLDKEDSSQRVDSDNKDTVYRHIVIDGSNVAMSHGNKEVFSCEGIRLAVEWFRDRGCRDITVFVPQWRKESSRPDAPIKDQQILLELEKERILSFTPARRIGGKRMVCYDDRYVLNLASQEDGIVVSNDNYRDLLVENKDYKKVVEERLLMYSFVKDKFMPPDDPLGRHGPSLENFLRKEPCLPETLPPPCPYGKKCTYGNKCKFYHPERGNQPQKSVAEKLAEQAKQQMQEVKDKTKTSEERKKGKKQKQPEKRLLRRTDSSTLSSSDPLMPPPRPPRQGRDKSPQKDILELEHNMDNPEYKAYNDRLAELSKNIEDGRGGQRNKANDPLPQVPDVSIDESLGLLRPAWSPTQELVQTRSSQGREQLVTGHLDLAKTLSDEANRENQQKRAAQIRRQQQELKQDLLRQEAQFLSYSSADTESLSQQLQTGLSLQPDSRHHHQTPLLYVDPRLELQRRANSLPVQPVSYGYDQGSFYPDVSPQHLPSYPGAVPRQQQLYDQFVSGQGEELLTERGVTRSSSARSPVPQFSRAPGLSSMTRQNSTSDPLLNKLPDTSVPVDPIGSQSVNDPGYGHFSGMVSERPASQPCFYPGAVPSHPQYGQYAPSLPYHPPSSHAYVSHSPHRSPRPQTHPLHRTGAAGPVGQPHQMLTPPGYTPESGFPPDSPIPPTDKRYSLYYHLCGIFPEPHVRAVMNRYPLETNPRTLCMYIVGIGN